MYPTITLKPGREKSVLNRHPWLFSGALKNSLDLQSGEKVRERGNGSIVAIQDSQKNLLGYGHYAEDASLACKIFHFGNLPITIDDEFWNRKLQGALTYRSALGLVGNDKAYRLVHAEGDELPGLIIDVYGDTASIEFGCDGMAKQLPVIVNFLINELAIKNIHNNGWVLGGNHKAFFVEHNLKFEVDVEKGQKTGCFLDQRDNRALVAHYAPGKNVLDAFCYSGIFSNYALQAQASSVTSVDISADAIELCKRNVAANGFTQHHKALAEDCFNHLRTMSNDAYDLIILDPPAFAKTAASVKSAARGYKDINLWAMKKIRQGGILFTFSCSQHISRDLFQKIIFAAAKDANRSVRIMHHMSQSVDHPISIFHPEGEYLKGLVLFVE